MLLIGSQALNHYIPLKRIMHDWDFMMSEADYEAWKARHTSWKHIKSIDNTHIWEFGTVILEIHTEAGFTPSDKIIFDCIPMFKKVESPVGLVSLPKLQHLYDIKKSTAAHIDEPKHKADVQLIEENFQLEQNSDLYRMRLEETKNRIEKQNKVKYDFFHKYHIPEYIKHDYLHEVIADGISIPYPTYKRIIDAEVNVSKELFNWLTYNEKVSLMVEESLVLALERWFIPQMVEKGINYRLIPIFFNDNEGLPTYQLLKHCCITGLKGEKEYITSFAREEFFSIEKAWKDAKQQMKNKGGLSVEFYDKLFKVRDLYKQGEKVATV